MFNKYGLTIFYQYSRLRAKVKRLLRRDALRNAVQVEGHLKYQPGKFWKYVKSKRSSDLTVSDVKVNNHLVTCPAEISRNFGIYFQSVCEPAVDTSFASVSSYFMESPLPVLTSAQVALAIRELNDKAAAGLHEVPPFIVKGLSDLLSPILVDIFNWSLRERKFPENWKNAKITPIPKKENDSNITNFRPISVLGVLSKIFEKLLSKAFLSYIRPSVAEEQHGFLSCRSTSSNLSTLLKVVGPVVESQGQVDVVYLDFEKAFDKVPHDVLLKIMIGSGFPSSLVRWTSSYLSDRKFRVRYGAVTSAEFSLTSRVPQGSNLGPLLFLIFITDIVIALVVRCCCSLMILRFGSNFLLRRIM